MRNNILLTILVTLSSSVFSQTIKLDFPHFANKEYAFWVFQADTQDTLSVGKLDSQGKATLVIPPSHKGFRGLSQWRLTEGGGLDLIINNENFIIGSSETIPDSNNITYSGSDENEFFIKQYEDQQTLLTKISVMQQALEIYPKTDTLYPSFEKELKGLNTAFEALQHQTATSPLYAGRLRQIIDYQRGIGSRLHASEQDGANDFNRFMVDQLKMEDLYTSGSWNDLIDSWFSMQTNVIKNDSLLLADTRTILSRIISIDVYTAFAEKIVVLYSKYGKDDLLHLLAADFANSGKLNNPGSYLQRLTAVTLGSPAPKVEGLDYNLPNKGKTLLFFYESGCGNCSSELRELKNNYSKLNKQNIRVISIAADRDQNVFNMNSSDFEWNDKLCDLKGVNGINFKNFGVIGTPTIIVIDENNNISGRYARLIDTGLITKVD